MENAEQLTIFENEFDTTIIEIEDTPYVPFKHHIYGKGISIYPHIPSKEGNKYLHHLRPLEEYDKVLIGLSGGKDSIAATLYLLELGVPKDKIVLLHHSIDGAKNNNPRIKMDWPCTEQYCEQFAKAMGLQIKYSWREEGFIGEILRLGSAKPVQFEELDNDVITTSYSPSWYKTQGILKKLETVNEEDEEYENLMLELKSLGYRFKFPAKSPNLSTRWCSSSLKIEVCDKLLRFSRKTYKDCKILFIDGIRREESGNRSRYNEMEIHTTNADTKNRLVHHWRPIIDWNEKMVWDIMKRHRINPSPVYIAGWNRCSCAMCIFSQPHHFAGIREVLPTQFNQLVELEKELGFTVDNKKDLLTYVGNAKSCIPQNIDPEIIEMLRTGNLPENYIIVAENKTWEYPTGAFHGAEGGPC